MEKILKSRETLRSRQRVRRTFDFEKTDRVTIGYETNGAIHHRLCAALGIPGDDMELLRQALGVDYRGIWPRYTGPNLFTPPPGLAADPLEGCNMRWVEHGTGGYWDFCCFPLKDADDEAFSRFPVPSPDDFDYDGAYKQARAYGDLALYVGAAGIPDVINSNGRIMGMEDVLCHLLTGNEAAMAFIHRRADLHFEVLRRTLEKCRGLIDFMWLGEDLGTQIAPMVSPALYRRAIRPIHQRFVDLARAYGIPAMFHTCGSSSWVYEDFIAMGVRGWIPSSPRRTT
jgi:uroporphyrinogen decarboxylase